MICQLCKEEKLSEEFPFKPLSETDCDHPLLHCLRCATASVKNSQKCSQCDTTVKEDNKQYQKYVETLNFLFPDVGAEDEPLLDSSQYAATDGASSNILVTTLSGESTNIPYNPDETIHKLKDTIALQLGPPRNKQCLLYKETELKTFDKDNNHPLRLKDYNVPPNCTIHLIILLFQVPEGLDHVTFDLFWGYPAKGRDYLDASVLLYSGFNFINLVDYCHTANNQPSSAVKHSGDVMDDQKRLGHHTINVSIKSIPPHIDKLVFTLSAWSSPNISKYPDISLQFFDANFPDKQLCSDEMSDAEFSQAIIMCSLSKWEGIWQVISLKTPSGGNATNYEPLQSNIVDLIQKKYI